MGKLKGSAKEGPASKKRKAAEPPTRPSKKAKQSSPKPPRTPVAIETPPLAQKSTSSSSSSSLSPTHETLIDELKTKVNILPVFVISSNPIRKRITRVLEHLAKDDGDPRPNVVLLHARPPEVCKMITIAEQAKRILAADGKKWIQYNMMYPLPQTQKEVEVIEETVLGGKATEGDEESEDDDDFEQMESWFAKATASQTAPRQIMSLGIFLCLGPVAELKARPDVSVQTVDDGGI